MRTLKDGRPGIKVLLLCGLLYLHAPVAYAASLLSCQPGQSALLCRLESVLDLLYGLAAFLGLALAIAIGAAIRLYRRRRSDRSVIR